MKIIYDEEKIKEGIEAGFYDNDTGLQRSKSGKHLYPSKFMLIRLLELVPQDIPGTASIWSFNDWETGETTIHLEIKFTRKELEEVSK